MYDPWAFRQGRGTMCGRGASRSHSIRCTARYSLRIQLRAIGERRLRPNGAYHFRIVSGIMRNELKEIVTKTFPILVSETNRNG